MDYHFVYITTNLKTKKSYVGSHSTNNLLDSYLGSGILIKKSLLKYGKKAFKRKILEIFPSRKEAVNKEEFYIKKYQTLIPKGYNISEFGNAAFPGNKNPMYGRDAWNKGLKMSADFCLKMQENAVGNNYHLGKKHAEKTKNTIGEKHKGNTYRLGKKATDEERKVSEKISNNFWQFSWGLTILLPILLLFFAELRTKSVITSTQLLISSVVGTFVIFLILYILFIT